MTLYHILKEDCEGVIFTLGTFDDFNAAQEFLQKQLIIQDNLREIDEYAVYMKEGSFPLDLRNKCINFKQKG